MINCHMNLIATYLTLILTFLLGTLELTLVLNVMSLKIKIESIKIELSLNSECKKLKQQLDEIKLQKEQHHKDAETFYVRKRNARFKAQWEQRFESIAFDFQKNLNLPNLSTNDFYYRRKLAFYSFNIHVLSSNEVFLYCYDETIARKGADEVTSMLYDFFMKHLDKEIRSVELFCDSCAGQNKNYTLIRFMDFLMKKKGLTSLKLCIQNADILIWSVIKIWG